jgi:hypothetical protein
MGATLFLKGFSVDYCRRLVLSEVCNMKVPVLLSGDKII